MKDKKEEDARQAKVGVTAPSPSVATGAADAPQERSGGQLPIDLAEASARLIVDANNTIDRWLDACQDLPLDLFDDGLTKELAKQLRQKDQAAMDEEARIKAKSVNTGEQQGPADRRDQRDAPVAFLEQLRREHHAQV